MRMNDGNKVEYVLNDVKKKLGKEMIFLPLSGGSTNASFKAECLDDTKYVIKIQRSVRGLDMQEALRKYLDTVDMNHAKLVCSYSPEGLSEIYVTISEWVDGKTLDLKKISIDSSKLKERVHQAVHTVKGFHKLFFESPDVVGIPLSVEDSIQKINKALQFIESKAIQFPYQNEIIQIAVNNIRDIVSPVGCVHMDLRPENMVFKGDRCILIDMETVAIDHIWADFAYAVDINFFEERTFWFLFLNDYFDDNIPEAFWRETREQVLIRFLFLMQSNWNIGKIERQYDLAEKIYADYDGGTNYIPAWYWDISKK